MAHRDGGVRDPDARLRFDGLFRFYDQHRSTIDDRLMDWFVPADEASGGADDDSAFDGDADAAYALLLADVQWGSDGDVDYAAEGRRILAGEAVETGTVIGSLGAAVVDAQNRDIYFDKTLQVTAENAGELGF